VVLPNTNMHNAKKYGQWICDQILSLAIPHAFSPTLPFVTVSVGIASVIPSSQTTFENLITTADSALYLAKESGRNQHKVATIEPESIREVG
jgi:diguanylate cyclase (GGDEF)-like protein